MATVDLLNPPFKLAFSTARTVAGIAVPATAASGSFGNVVTNPGTTGGSSVLTSEVANASTASDKVLFDFTFPAERYEGDTFPMFVNVTKVLSASAIATCTLTASVREVGSDGTLGVELVNTGASTIFTNIAAGDVLIDINAGTLSIGDRVQVLLGMTVVETATHNANGVLNSVRFGA